MELHDPLVTARVLAKAAGVTSRHVRKARQGRCAFKGTLPDIPQHVREERREELEKQQLRDQWYAIELKYISLLTEEAMLIELSYDILSDDAHEDVVITLKQLDDKIKATNKRLVDIRKQCDAVSITAIWNPRANNVKKLLEKRRPIKSRKAAKAEVEKPSHRLLMELAGSI
jgi:hypothetical protein